MSNSAVKFEIALSFDFTCNSIYWKYMFLKLGTIIKQIRQQNLDRNLIRYIHSLFALDKLLWLFLLLPKAFCHLCSGSHSLFFSKPTVSTGIRALSYIITFPLLLDPSHQQKNVIISPSLKTTPWQAKWSNWVRQRP